MKIAEYYEEQRRAGGDARIVISLANHWRGALLNNAEASVEHIIRACGYLITAAGVLTAEENREESDRMLTDCVKLLDLLPPEHDEAKQSILASVHERKSSTPGLNSSCDVSVEER